MRAVYPRWRGNIYDRTTDKKNDGLSPLARGTTYLTGLAALPSLSPLAREREHSLIADGFAAGLSPLARGTLPANAGRRTKERFIPLAREHVFRRGVGEGAVYPAGAGNTRIKK